MKRLFAILMAVVMTVSLLTVGAFAAEPTHSHEFNRKTLLTESTCLTEGIVVSYCSGEGECELPNRMWSEPLPKVPCEKMDEPLGAREATCTADGYTGDYCCKWCLSVLDEGEVIPKTGHKPGEWIVDGWSSNWHTTVQVRVCANCKQIVEKQELPADPNNPPAALVPHDHVFGETVIEIEPTCQTEGLSVSRCTADGFCDIIGRTKTEVLPKTECVPADERIGAVEATCATEGRTGDLICKWCLTVLEESKVIPKKDHTPADQRIGDFEATCVTEGRTGTLLCKDCFAVAEESKVIAKTAHKPGDWITDELLSNDEKTVQHRFCKTCLQIVDTKEVPVVHPDSPFGDVYYDDYYFDSVLWAVDKKITAGTAPNTFSPDKVITRAEVVTMLWRAAGSPAPKFDWNPFTDVSADAYYYNAVLWAVEKDVTVGTTKTTFSPDELCTRAQVMTMLWRAKGSPLAEDAKDLFIDVAKDDYFYAPVLWATENGITGGTGLFLFSPDAPCSRAQIVTFLYKAK